MEFLYPKGLCKIFCSFETFVKLFWGQLMTQFVPFANQLFLETLFFEFSLIISSKKNLSETYDFNSFQRKNIEVKVDLFNIASQGQKNELLEAA